MDTASTLGGFLPIWILGAPLLWAFYERTTTPRAHGLQDRRDTAYTGVNPQPLAAARA